MFIMLRFAFRCLKNRFCIEAASFKYTQRKRHFILPHRSDVTLESRIEGLLIDITGVLYESGKKCAIEGSVEAIEKLRRKKIPFKFLTNESQSTRAALAKKLQSFGFNITEEEIYSPGIAASLYIQENKLRPYLLVHPDLLPEFSNCDQTSPNCVVVGDAGDNFSYKNMNHAFSILMKTENPVLVSLGQGKYYQENDELVMDLGGFTAALEYATGVKATVIGKPASNYFFSALKSMHLGTKDVAMIGDDIYSDVCASQKIGFMGILVRTGKFRQKDIESRFVKPDAVVANLAEFVDTLCKHK